jgi:predicted transport protein
MLPDCIAAGRVEATGGRPFFAGRRATPPVPGNTRRSSVLVGPASCMTTALSAAYPHLTGPLLALFHDLDVRIRDLGKDVIRRDRRVYIGYHRSRMFVKVFPQSGRLFLHLMNIAGRLDDPQQLAVAGTMAGHYGNVHVELKGPEHLDAVLALIRQSYIAARSAHESRVTKSDVLWAALEDEGFEHLLLTTSSSTIRADGLIVRRENDGPAYRAHYKIECDPLWRVRAVEIDVTDPDAGHLDLTSDGNGIWLDADCQPIAPLNGCTDIDIQASPFTNTLPIRRLRLNDEATARIDVVYIDPRTATFERTSQRYTRLRGTDGGSGLYHYTSLDSGFETVLAVDADGLVIDYPHFFRRAWSR